jgi:hypothetical protein
LAEALVSTFTGPAVSTVARVWQELWSPSPLTSKETMGGRVSGAVSPGAKNFYEAGRAVTHAVKGDEPLTVRGNKGQLQYVPTKGEAAMGMTGVKTLRSSELIDYRNIEAMHREEIKKLKERVEGAILQNRPEKAAVLAHAYKTILKYDPETKFDLSRAIIQKIEDQNIPELQRQMMTAPASLLPALRAINR